MTQLLITVFGVPAPVLVGTDLACAAVTKTAGTLVHRAHAISRRASLGSFGWRCVPVTALRMMRVATLTIAGVKLLS